MSIGQVIPQNPIDGLAESAPRNPGRIAMIDLGRNRSFTYAQIHDRVSRLARAWQVKYGIRPGDRVAVVARNSTDQYEMMFAAWRIGAVFTPLNWRLAPDEIKAIIADAEPALIVADEEFSSLLMGLAPPIQRRQKNSPVGYESDIAAHDGACAPVQPLPETINTLLYTSGTTGVPKGVIGTWRMTMTMLAQSDAHQALGCDTAVLTSAPQFHTAGLNAFAVPTLFRGGAVAVMPSWDAGAALRHLADPALKITHTLGVPTQYDMMARHELFSSAVFPTLRVAAVGGAPPTIDLMTRWAAKGYALTPGYGMTEVFGVATITAAEALSKPGAVGRAQQGTQIRIANENGEPCPSGIAGEIQIKGAGVTPGYWRKPDLNRSAFIDGWLRTGDTGVMDPDGLLTVLGRAKDMFISGGENVYPAEVENVISTFPEVKQVVVVGIPDLTWGEVGKAVVVLHPGAVFDLSELTKRCRRHLAAYKVPKHLDIATSLPVNEQGKVIRSALRP